MRNLIKNVAIIAIVASTVAVATPSAFAGSKTATFDVTLNIQDDCSISANPLNFGDTGALTDNVDQSSNLAVTCTTGTPYNVALDAGTATGSQVATRKLANAGGTATVDFNLYRDAARTQLWGQTTGTDTTAGVGNGKSQSLVVYGRVPSQTTPAAGTYSSTVTATVVF
ncbi:spore coat U domain-containing protein [Caballeronia sp. LP006]|jgi:spore coat protein U-like protein|uniref:Csu type fimbrial protein n=1 Tax=unclassified Caballeronia TaxID=2646786 RepID=UPI001FD0BAC9|nr:MULTISPECIES: spore coat U domain-containing protein [unclassified Caballeronia]MDR5770806.1 spore coat U domain-containing protein [Caballeronia sp. LZ002]MDR5802801.1 spore coat U domain-containing protein [Caballeronia sp. LZ001]MDR5830549.1 spore coat U domain-containing protein [Caballeronia sp. LP006]MDR5846243.1 spore coat U domain-containing protein [Caballeronia sp. LZ003]